MHPHQPALAPSQWHPLISRLRPYWQAPSHRLFCIYGLLDQTTNCIYILSLITWDEPKRLENIRKHKIDLADLEPLFDYPMVTVEDSRESYGELRLQSLGMWQGRVVFLVWTPRGEDTAHLISCPYADRQETDDYFQAI